MNTKQLTYPSIEEQQKYWIDKESESRESSDAFSSNVDAGSNAPAAHHYGVFCECEECTGNKEAQHDPGLTEAQSDNATHETRAPSGSASIHIDKCGNTLTVRHGETGDLLLKREAIEGFWESHLWPLLEGKQS